MLDEMKLQIIDGKQIRSDNTIRLGSGIHGSGTITRTWNHPDDGPITPEVRMCSGCHDDFYNRPGNSTTGMCWSFTTAVVCNKVGYSSIHVANGPDTKMEKTLTCWHGVRK